MKNLIKKYILFFLFSSILIFLDQYTKFLATLNLKNGNVVVIIKNILEFFYVENDGAAFGILKGQQYFFYLVTLFVLIGILIYIYKIPFEKKYIPIWIAISMLFSGSVGNFIDRITKHFVVDFIYFKPIDFPVFNVADILITISCILFIILFLFFYREDDIKLI